MIRSFFKAIIVVLLLIISFTSFDFITSFVPGWNTTIMPLPRLEIYIWLWSSCIAIILFTLKSRGFTNAKPLRYFLWLAAPFLVLSIIRRLSAETPPHVQYFIFVLILLPYLLSILLFILAHPVTLWQLYKSRNFRNKN